MEVKDCNWTLINDGDTVIITKDLKVKWMKKAIKKWTVIKNARLRHGDDENVDCRIKWEGELVIKTCFLKKKS